MEIKLTDDSKADVITLFSEYDDFIMEFLGDDKVYYKRYHSNEKLEPIWVAHCGEIPVGCVAFRRIDSETGEVKRLFVRDKYRGKGVSKSLLAVVVNYIKENDYKRLCLDTRITLEPAVSLYRSFGFVDIYRDGLYVKFEKQVE